MLDFTKLRKEVSGFRGAFEGLICHLGRRHAPVSAVEFVTIQGAGGDGGLEAYWICNESQEVGYQAKFHLKPGDIDWDKIDGSVRAALTSHPKMNRMIIALACDLTNVVPGRRGKSARQHWNDHKEKWEKELANREVAFEYWDASKIEDLLISDCANGLRGYWFEEVELSQLWFSNGFTKAAASLDDRYHPEDHVNVSAEMLFAGLLQDARLRQTLAEQIEPFRGSLPDWLPETPADLSGAFSSISSHLESLLSYERDERFEACSPVSWDRYRRATEAIHNHIPALADAISAYRSNLPSSKEHKQIQGRLDKVEGAIWHLHGLCEGMIDFLDGPFCLASVSRFAIISGIAGAGKSHLLASQIDSLIDAGTPAVLVLGSHFSPNRTIESQLPEILGLSCDFQTFVATLNAAAEIRGVRAIIAIDAINEGGGRRWLSELAALRHAAHQFPYLVLVVSCRTEYQPFLISDSVERKASVLVVPGFESEEEQELASQVYMDRRGILRPATPWLSPEFSNPLFLRTTALALEADGQKEYPPGLHGTKLVLSYFLKVLARHLSGDYDGSDTLVSPLFRAVRALAKRMAEQRQDYLAIDEAAIILDRAFSGFSLRESSWLELLRLRGILRLDPDLGMSGDDPLDTPSDVVRFAFQRFQDHLIAEALLIETMPAPKEFESGGRLAFLLQRFPGHRYCTIDYGWQGVFEALWIGHAERNGRELVDDLPADATDCFDDNSFVQSVYWRKTSAFTARTLELFNDWLVKSETFSFEHIRVLLRLCVNDHPWNAEMLHRDLASQTLPRRDLKWTHPINIITQYGDDNEVERLIRWCTGEGVSRATDDTLRRALLTLGWLFASTNRAIRDRATKAAIYILLKRSQLTPAFISDFAVVDDPYVVERVMAACAGSCLRDPNEDRLSGCAQATFEALFANGVAPVNLMIRDYARTVIELAHDAGVLSPVIDIDLCRPPYGAKPPRFVKDTSIIERRAQSAGADSILRSCTGWGGDFGRHVISSRVDDFSHVRLSRPAPTEPDEDAWLLKEKLTFDTTKAKFWVADRAISLGWKETLFPRDHYDDVRKEHSRVERIGKKYQWIALYELLARLADNYWMFGHDVNFPMRRYETTVDTSFVRNIEITLPAFGDEIVELNRDFEPRPFVLNEVETDEQEAWVFESGIAERALSTGATPDISTDGWVCLYRYSSAALNWPSTEEHSRHEYRQNEFHIQMMIGVPSTYISSLGPKNRRAKTDFHDWLPETRTDEGYVYELGLRPTWGPSSAEQVTAWRGAGTPHCHLSVGYHWEHHLDSTIPHGLEMHLPAPWVIEALSLRADPDNPGQFRDCVGELVIVSGRSKGSQWYIARRDAVERALRAQDLEPAWIAFGERSTWPEGHVGIFRRVRWNGTMVEENGGNSFTVWEERTTVQEDR
jgi:hypothetical protein